MRRLNKSVDTATPTTTATSEQSHEPDLPLNGRHVVVVGAGPAGALAAIIMARRGFLVDVYERRGDPANLAPDAEANVHGYPMVLSSRALTPLVELGLDMPTARPWERPYLGSYNPVTGATIPSSNDPLNPETRTAMVNRQSFGRELVSAARQRHPTRVTFHFDAAVASLDVGQRYIEVEFAETGGTENASTAAVATGQAAEGPKKVMKAVSYDLLVAADGANSRIREALQAQLGPRFPVTLLATADSSYRTFKNLELPAPEDAAGTPLARVYDHGPYGYLYMNAKGTTRLVLAKNTSGSLDGLVIVDRWDPPEAIFTELHGAFPTLPVGWWDAIINQVKAQPNSTFGRIVRCGRLDAPRVVLLGDAAHAVTSALGQGATSALEDVAVLDKILEELEDDLDRVPSTFSARRLPDVHALQAMEFAMLNNMLKRITFPSTFLQLCGMWGGLVAKLSLLAGFMLHKLVPRLVPSPLYQFWAMRQRRYSYAFVRVVTRCLAVVGGVALVAVVGAAVAAVLTGLKALRMV